MRDKTLHFNSKSKTSNSEKSLKIKDKPFYNYNRDLFVLIIDTIHKSSHYRETQLNLLKKLLCLKKVWLKPIQLHLIFRLFSTRNPLEQIYNFDLVQTIIFVQFLLIPIQVIIHSIQVIDHLIKSHLKPEFLRNRKLIHCDQKKRNLKSKLYRRQRKKIKEKNIINGN